MGRWFGEGGWDGGGRRLEVVSQWLPRTSSAVLRQCLRTQCGPGESRGHYVLLLRVIGVRS